MSKEDYYRFQITLYFIVAAIGGVFIRFSFNLPVRNIDTGEILQAFSLPFFIFGIVLIFLSCLGLILFSEPREDDITF